MLGLRTTYKPDLKCSAAELVYGTTLRLLGEFFEPSVYPPSDTNDYASRLRAVMDSIRPTPTRHCSSRAVFVSPDLSSCTHVFVRTDAVRRSLQQPYHGPYEVLCRDSKHMTILIKGRKDVISLDRVKPAHLDLDSPVKSSAISITTRTKRRRVRFATTTFAAQLQ